MAYIIMNFMQYKSHFRFCKTNGLITTYLSEQLFYKRVVLIVLCLFLNDCISCTVNYQKLLVGIIMINVQILVIIIVVNRLAFLRPSYHFLYLWSSRDWYCYCKKNIKRQRLKLKYWFLIKWGLLKWKSRDYFFPILLNPDNSIFFDELY